MRRIGFSTGAVAKGDFRRGLDALRQKHVTVVELSALRLIELEPLIRALPDLDLSSFEFVSVHAPSHLAYIDEAFVTNSLSVAIKLGIPVVVHPDVIFEENAWRWMGRLLLIENMDKRKAIGRTAQDLEVLFNKLPESGFCFDIGHARQVDPTMTEARSILQAFSGRLAQVHISEVNTNSRHDPLSIYAISAFRAVADLIPEGVPVVLETIIDEGQSDIQTEIQRAQSALQFTHAVLPSEPGVPAPRQG
ncbi:MAG: hypothetical protein WD696_07530 [Bryobacteraceae bacterium]